MPWPRFQVASRRHTQSQDVCRNSSQYSWCVRWRQLQLGIGFRSTFSETKWFNFMICVTDFSSVPNSICTLDTSFTNGLWAYLRWCLHKLFGLDYKKTQGFNWQAVFRLQTCNGDVGNDNIALQCIQKSLLTGINQCLRVLCAASHTCRQFLLVQL